jgi:hypothetical protein
MAHSSKVEYEIGLLISQALQKVGDLVTLDGQRVTMHRTLSNQSPESLNMLVIRPALRQALHEIFNSESKQVGGVSHSSTPPSHKGDLEGPSMLPGCEPAPLTSHQLQELGTRFGRDPSSLSALVRTMWYSGNVCPDFTNIVTPSSSILGA